jgi:hypothetical protein
MADKTKAQLQAELATAEARLKQLEGAGQPAFSEEEIRKQMEEEYEKKMEEKLFKMKQEQDEEMNKRCDEGPDPEETAFPEYEGAKITEGDLDGYPTGILTAYPHSIYEHEVQNEVRKLMAENKGKASIFKKISIVLEGVKRVEKNGMNTFHNYAYATEGDIVDGIRPILAEAGLALWTSIQYQERTIKEVYSRGKSVGHKTFTKVLVRFTLGDSDTGQTLESEYWGEGEDESDKGLYKAYTGAQKYFLSKTFLISSGDTDPEADHAGQYQPEPQNKGGKQQNKQNQGKGNQKPQNQNQGNSEPDNNVVQQEKASLLGKFVALGGDEAGFNAWYTKQAGNKQTHANMAIYLDKKLAEKREKEQPEQQEEKQQEPQETPQEEQGGGPDLSASEADEEWAKKTEEEIPFELTEEEKAQLNK